MCTKKQLAELLDELASVDIPEEERRRIVQGVSADVALSEQEIAELRRKIKLLVEARPSMKRYVLAPTRQDK
jgi:hypothetical protein